MFLVDQENLTNKTWKKIKFYARTEKIFSNGKMTVNAKGQKNKSDNTTMQTEVQNEKNTEVLHMQKDKSLENLKNNRKSIHRAQLY
jgi:hypothetical protein